MANTQSPAEENGAMEAKTDSGPPPREQKENLTPLERLHFFVERQAGKFEVWKDTRHANAELKRQLKIEERRQEEKRKAERGEKPLTKKDKREIKEQIKRQKQHDKAVKIAERRGPGWVAKNGRVERETADEAAKRIAKEAAERAELAEKMKQSAAPTDPVAHGAEKDALENTNTKAPINADHYIELKETPLRIAKQSDAKLVTPPDVWDPNNSSVYLVIKNNNPSPLELRAGELIYVSGLLKDRQSSESDTMLATLANDATIAPGMRKNIQLIRDSSGKETAYLVEMVRDIPTAHMIDYHYGDQKAVQTPSVGNQAAPITPPSQAKLEQIAPPSVPHIPIKLNAPLRVLTANDNYAVRGEHEDFKGKLGIYLTIPNGRAEEISLKAGTILWLSGITRVIGHGDEASVKQTQITGKLSTDSSIPAKGKSENGKRLYLFVKDEVNGDMVYPVDNITTVPADGIHTLEAPKG